MYNSLLLTTEEKCYINSLNSILLISNTYLTHKYYIPTIIYHSLIFINFSNKMSIKLFTISMISVFFVGYVAGEYCYNDVVGACSPVGWFNYFICDPCVFIFYIYYVIFAGGEIQSCNSRYGAFKGDELMVNIQGYANSHILKSFQFLLMVNIDN